jgi:hypothetical protein
LGGLPRPKLVFVLVTALVFFVFILNIFVNSFSADYRIALRDTASYYSTGSLMPLFHLSGELTGEVGVILRFVGACYLLAFAVMLTWKKTVSWSFLRKAVLLEGIYYVFNIVFIIYLFVKGNAFANYGAATSYLTQMLLVTPIFLTLYFKMKKNVEIQEIAKWGALAIIGFIFALWSKHFLLALYALPLTFSNLSFLVGFLNSALTLLVAGIVLLVVLAPVYRKKSLSFNTKAFGAALILAGLYAVFFVVIALFTPEYRSWITLIDWWTIAFIVLGIGYLTIKKSNP